MEKEGGPYFGPGNRMSLFTIADLHLSLGVNKPMDVFPGWENYVERLTENWQKTVKPEDTVVIAGDISWGLIMEESRADFEYLHKLNGTKIILKGNHDYWFTTKTKVEKALSDWGCYSIKILFNNAYEYGDYALCGTRGWMNDQNDKKILLRECGRLRLSLDAGKKLQKEPIVFLHYPPVYGNGECYEILEILHEYGIKQVYYGHIHGYSSGYAINGERIGIDFRLVSCDYLQFCPKKIV